MRENQSTSAVSWRIGEKSEDIKDDESSSMTRDEPDWPIHVIWDSLIALSSNSQDDE